METTTPAPRAAFWLIAALLLLLGCGLRIVPWTSFQGMAYDESWYRKYVHALDAGGLAAYPDLCAAYLADGRDEKTIAKVPPLRALFVTSAYLWKRLAFGAAPPVDVNSGGDPGRDPALVSLHRVSTLFGCLGLFAALAFARRLFGDAEALAALALVACSPLLIHTSQHALIDSVYGTCALLVLWTLWEAMQKGARPAWLAAFGASFMLLVLAKENAIFPATGVAVLMLFGGPLGFGRADRRHWAAAFVGGLAAVALLSAAAGGFRGMTEVYLLFMHKVAVIPDTHSSSGGPWSRSLVDLMIFTPVTLCFALGGAFRVLREDRRALGLLVFVTITCAAMCQVRYGLNLRYTAIWDFPLRSLAALQAVALVARLPRQRVLLAVLIALLCALDLAQYHHFFVTYRLYELPTDDLLRAAKMLK